MNPVDFILTTDYATTKGDQGGSLSLNIPGSISIPGNTAATYSQTISLGSIGSSIRSRMFTSRNNLWIHGNTIVLIRNGTYGGSPGTYDIYATVNRSGPTEVRLNVFIANGTSVTLITQSGSETIEAVLSTFIPPFV